MMPAVEVEVEVYCARCGEGLCNQSEFRPPRRYMGTGAIIVAPCERCMEAEYDRGRESEVE